MLFVEALMNIEVSPYKPVGRERQGGIAGVMKYFRHGRCSDRQPAISKINAMRGYVE